VINYDGCSFNSARHGLLAAPIQLTPLMTDISHFCV